MEDDPRTAGFPRSPAGGLCGEVAAENFLAGVW
jgi:hypothetical protein